MVLNVFTAFDSYGIIVFLLIKGISEITSMEKGYIFYFLRYTEIC